jgi:hypothetical protein
MLNPDLPLPTFFQVFGKLLAKNNHTTLRKGYQKELKNNLSKKDFGRLKFPDDLIIISVIYFFITGGRKR